MNNDQLNTKLNGLLAKSADADTKWSVEIRAFGPYDQRLNVFTSHARDVVRPASTLKIFTTWTALRLWPTASDTSTSTFSYLQEMMKFSDNNMAQSTYDRLGGTPAVLETFGSAGIIPNESFRMLDGSGLRYDNRVAAHDLVNVLMSIRSSSKMRAFRAMLPVAGVDGTLASRMTDIQGRVAAKTGTLVSDPAVALAGFGDGQNGWQIVFAMLGDSMTTVDAGRGIVDEMVRATLQAINKLPSTKPAFEFYDDQGVELGGLTN
jgi:D-alanyl-D-alanine carboxypeptidase